MSMRAGEASVQPDVVEREGAGEGRVRAVTELVSSGSARIFEEVGH